MAFPGWTRKCQLTVDSGIAEYDQTDFPFLFTEDNLPSEMFDADGSFPALNGGGDIRFSSDADGNTRLSIEVVNFVTDNNPANGKAEIWVKIPLVSNTTGFSVYVWYGKAGETQPARDAAYGSEDVWSNGYAAVYHFNEDPSLGTLNDSTANENHGTVYNMESADLVDGPYGKAWAPDGTDEYVLVPDSASLEPTSVSLLAVVNLPTTQASGYPKLVHKGYDPSSPYGSYCLQHENSANAITMQIGRSDGTRKSTGTGIYQNQWIQLCGNTFEGGRYTNIWQNETQYDADDHGTGSILYDSTGLGIFTGGSGTGTKWIGQMEELRIRTTGSSEGYMDTTHRTQLQIGTYTTVGTPVSNALSINLTGYGIASGEAFGSPSLSTGNVNVSPNGIASAEAFGSLTLSVGNVNIAPNGIASEEAFGDLTITTGNVDISPNGIESAEAFGHPFLTPYTSIFPEGIPSEEAFGEPTIVNALVLIEPLGIGSEEAFGTPSLVYMIDPPGIPSEEAFGLPIVSVGTVTVLSPYGIESGEAFGNPTLVQFPLYAILPNGIPSGEAWGSPAVGLQDFIYPIGIESAEAWGLLAIGKQIILSGIPSGEAFGEPILYAGTGHVYPNGIESAEAFGDPTVSVGTAYIAPSGVPSEEAFGTPTLNVGNVDVAPDGIPSSEQWGTPTLGVGSTYVVPNGISSQEAFGTPTVTVGYIDIAPQGIPSAEQWGTPYVTVSGVQISPYSIESGEAWGTLSVSVGPVNITPLGIVSEEQWGTVLVTPGTVDITPYGIESQETFGTVNLSMQIQVEGIVTEEQWGSPTLSVGPVDIILNGIASQEQWGTPIVRNVLVIDMDGYGIESAEEWGLPIVTLVVLNEFMQLVERDIEETILNLEEFAINAIYIHKNGVQFTLAVIYDNETLMVDAASGAPVISRDPMVIAQTSKFTVAPTKGDKMIINGVRYQVVDHLPDGTGISTLQLHHERTV